CRTELGARRELPAIPPAWLSVCEAYILLGSMICLEHEITDRPELAATAEELNSQAVILDKLTGYFRLHASTS
ncbi:hypothetical protein ACUHMQ_14780, partial [Chitinimonas sp. PSY-7]|uniref:hypothetical protein n=1 Tax=Chitinimonas sp. PSY-7 TaxID=3459088 RepID=UPI00403FDB18